MATPFVRIASKHSYREGTAQSSSSTDPIDEDKVGKPENMKTLKANDATGEVCPFVCGICSEKFEKISPFYAHLKTHGSFESLQTSKKNEILNALDVHDKVDENIFRCGICEIEFPTMSLLHDHMVLEENITNYHYSNVDHTARPNSRAIDVRLSRVSPAKSKESSISNYKRKASSALVSGQKRKKKQSDDESNDTPGIETGEDSSVDRQVLSSSGSKSKSKTKTTSEQPVINSVVSPFPSTRSSSRLSRSRSTKRVDYKALAGIISPKIENEYINDRLKGNQEQSLLSTQAEKMNVAKGNKVETSDGNDGGDEDQRSNYEQDSKKSNWTKSTSATNEKNISAQEEPVMETVKESAKDATTNTEEEADLNKDESETESAGFKEDGTHDTGRLSMEVLSVKTEILDDEFLSDNDSDDDFGDFQGDQKEDDYNLMNDLQDRKLYLKKHGFKTKQRLRRHDGRVVKNCLYPCSVCGKYFIWKALKKHSFAHIKVKSVECPQCGKKYKSKRHLGDHVRSVHSMAKYRCGHCGDILKGKQGFEKHATLHVLKKDIEGCMDDINMYEVTDEEYLHWKHTNGKREALKKRKKPLVIVAEDAQNDAEATEDFAGPIHGQGVELDKGLVGSGSNLDCKVCSKHFQTHDSLVVHMLEHKEDKQFRCEVCQAFFLTHQHLENHIAQVHGQSIHECDVCGERFKNVYAMWSHKGKHLMKTDKYYSEDIVKKLQAEIKTRKSKKRLTSMKKPTVRKSQVCEICGAVVLASRVKRHMEIHKDTKEWECEICHKFYKTRRYLIDHKKKTHFAEMTSCDICGQTFRGRAYLEIHKQIHGPRDKKCPYCDKGFTTLMYLRAHLTTHQEKKQYKCEMCPAAFSHKQRLHIHMLEIHLQGESRPCKYCGELFPSREKARKHERRIHEGVRYTRNRSRGREEGEIGVLEINVSGGQSGGSTNSDNKKIIQFIPPEHMPSNVTTIKVPSGNKSTMNGSVKVSKSLPQLVQSDAISGEGQFIKFENGDEYQLMLEGADGEEPVEVIELSEEQHNVFIQETSEEALAAQSLEVKDENVEQILEIPENAEQCQILLFPDGSFKLLNVVDNTTS